MKKQTYQINEKTIDAANYLMRGLKQSGVDQKVLLNNLESKFGKKAAHDGGLFMVNELLNEKASLDDITAFLYFGNDGEQTNYGIIWKNIAGNAA